MSIRIRVKKAPKTGDQDGFGLSTSPASYSMGGSNAFPGSSGVNTTLKPVADDEANIEAELGETITGDFDQDGMLEHFKVGGKKHSNGGTPLKVPGGAFVFSDTKKLSLTGDVLENFGKKNTKKKFTPADLAKQYDLNKFKKILQDPSSDKLDRDTAELMIENNTRKLGELALVQESKKGFPTGVPEIAMPIVHPESAPQAMDSDEYKFGGPVFRKGGSDDPQDPTHKGDKRASKNPVTGVSSRNWNAATKYKTLEEYGDAVGFVADKPSDYTAKNIQQFVMKQYPEIVKKYHTQYGMPLTGKPDDGKLGIRWQGIADEISKIPTVSLDEQDRTFIEPNKEIISPSDYVTQQRKIPNTQTSGRGLVPNKFNPTTEKAKTAPWWTQDKINFGAALKNRYDIKKYMPDYVGVNSTLPDASFFDPTRQLMANQEQARTSSELSALYAGPQRQRANDSQIQGQALTFAANTLGQFANQNVEVANNLSGVRAGIKNNDAYTNAQARKRYLDEVAIGNQQYDNAVVQGDASVLTNLQSGISNAQKTDWINRINPQYKIDPKTGKMLFTKGRDITSNSSNTGAGSDPFEAYKVYYEQFMSKFNDPAKAHEYAQKMALSSRSKVNTSNDGDTDYQYTTPGMGALNMQSLYGSMGVPFRN